MSFYQRCSNGCSQPRFEPAAEAQYGYSDLLAASSPSVLSTAAAVSAGSAAVAIGSGAPLLSIPGADTRPIVPQVSTTDPTGSATPGGGHRSTQLSKQDAKLYGSPAFGQSGATWGNTFCEVGTTPALWPQDGGGDSSPGKTLLGYLVAGLVVAAVAHDVWGKR